MHQLITHRFKRRGLPLLAAPAAGVALLAAACGSTGVTGSAYGTGSNQGSASGRTAAGGNPYGIAPAPAVTASIKVAMSSLGSFLTDGQGRTLYLFTRDGNNMASCTGACTSVWPPVTSGVAARAGVGAFAQLLSITSSAAGAQQVSYNGHPLYYYVGDIHPGDTNGEQLDQFGGLWYAVSPNGMQVAR